MLFSKNFALSKLFPMYNGIGILCWNFRFCKIKISWPQCLCTKKLYFCLKMLLFQSCLKCKNLWKSIVKYVFYFCKTRIVFEHKTITSKSCIFKKNVTACLKCKNVWKSIGKMGRNLHFLFFFTTSPRWSVFS